MESSQQPRSFPTTLWTVVLHAGTDDPDQARSALAQLCQAYWYPLYSFVRHRGHSAHDAQDLTQSFFAHLLEKQALEQVNRDLGRFRTFLLASLKNFLANEWDKAHAHKRGGACTIVSLDAERAESRYGLEPSHGLTPERQFERQWAMTLLERVLAALRAEYHDAGNGALFDELQAALTGQPEPHSVMANRLGRSEGAVKVAVHRLRRRYRELLREQIAATVGATDVEDELRHLLAVLG
jgi:RNA polymerase sigma factor (sigma-70 family)